MIIKGHERHFACLYLSEVTSSKHSCANIINVFTCMRMVLCLGSTQVQECSIPRPLAKFVADVESDGYIKQSRWTVMCTYASLTAAKCA